MTRRRRGFSLIEVIAAFGIALLMIGPIATVIGGVSGSFAGLERSAARRADLQAASAAAMTVSPLRPGIVSVGGYEVRIREANLEDSNELRQAGWRLYSLTVHRPGTPGAVLETIRIGRL